MAGGLASAWPEVRQSNTVNSRLNACASGFAIPWLLSFDHKLRVEGASALPFIASTPSGSLRPDQHFSPFRYCILKHYPICPAKLSHPQERFFGARVVNEVQFIHQAYACLH